MSATADVDRMIARGLASLHHQEAHNAPARCPEAFEDEPPSPRAQIARLQRALAAQSRRLDALEHRLAQLESLAEPAPA